ncbi:hypothetical protein NQ315_011186 [Exocentrus adspersus]|uniref:HTH CENPB-type domain-containing protein n=1 Tax=Exocentrus adspersus TaxID=1586481 RepID=A0AAV8V9B5_9CUCU|nr:hypothetical protein NQ315_011186 [Exocentrus adspersus]
MGRTYVRKTNRGSDGTKYSRETLMRAVADVQNGNKTVKGCSKFYSIPRTTLRHYLQGTRGKGVVAKAGSGGGGRMQLTIEQEQNLANLLKTMEKWGFGLCKQEVLDVVQVFIKRNAIKTRFANDRPGDEWFLNFRKRNRLSVKKPQGVEYVRVNQTNPFTIYGFFDTLCQKVDELNLLNKPHLIFNCDETSFCSDPSKTKVVGAVGTKSMRQISSAGRDNTTVLFCCSASGQKLPMLTVFKGKNIMETWMPGGPTDQTAFAASKKGWMDSIIFLNWFKKCFLPNIPLERPVLLIFDGHVSHISSELIQTAIENQVTLLKLPLHTTHILQPLDVAVFKSLKTRWDREIVQWQRENPRRKIPKDTFVKVLQKVYLNMPESNILNGFKSTGIYDPDVGGPNRLAISENMFRIDELRNYKKFVEENHLNVQNDDHDYARPVQEENLTNIEIDNPEESVNSETLNEPNNAMVLMTLLQDTARDS